MPLACRVLLMICDGLRRDLVTPQLMPNLARLAAGGVFFQASRAVFPTVTRANSASLATGMLPCHHGISGNEMVLAGVAGGGAFSTADARRLDELRAHRDGRVLLAPTLADRIAAAGGRTAVIGTGSPGAALVQNPQAETRADFFLHPQRFHGLSREQVERARGPIPRRETPSTALNAYATAFIRDVLLPAAQHDLIAFWHTDPDHTQHAHGLGAPEALRALRDCDANIGVLAAAVRERAPEPWVIAVTSDHGFASVDPTLGDANVAQGLVDAGLKKSLSSDDITCVEGGVYLKDSGAARVRAVAEALQAVPGIGAIFTDADDDPPPGTFALSAVGQGGPWAPPVQFSVAWSDARNAQGIAGLCAGPGGRLRGTHGSLSPFELRNTLVLAGSGVASGRESHVPAGITDVAPTLAHLLGLSWDGPRDGRVLHEARADGPAPEDIDVGEQRLEAVSERRTQELRYSVVEGVRYIDQGSTNLRPA